MSDITKQLQNAGARITIQFSGDETLVECSILNSKTTVYVADPKSMKEILQMTGHLALKSLELYEGLKYSNTPTINTAIPPSSIEIPDESEQEDEAPEAEDATAKVVDIKLPPKQSRRTAKPAEAKEKTKEIVTPSKTTLDDSDGF